VVKATDAEGNTTTMQRNIIYKKTSHTSTTLTYTGATLIAQGRNVILSGALKVDGANVPNLIGAVISFTLGNGSAGQSCIGKADADGTASCSISSVAAPLGFNTITATYAGDLVYQPSSDSKGVTIFAYPEKGAFVIGDKNTAVSSTVTFWGDQWRRDNALSKGSAPSAFKGFADITGTPSSECGKTWSASPGNSATPPNSIPSYMAVMVSSNITKSHNTISGDLKEIVIVKTDPGYGPDPGHGGTGTVVGVLCQSQCHHE